MLKKCINSKPKIHTENPAGLIMNRVSPRIKIKKSANRGIKKACFILPENNKAEPGIRRLMKMLKINFVK